MLIEAGYLMQNNFKNLKLTNFNWDMETSMLSNVAGKVMLKLIPDSELLQITIGTANKIKSKQMSAMKHLFNKIRFI